MIERGRPILREAVPLRRFDRYVVGGIGRCREARSLFQAQTLPRISHRGRDIEARISDGDGQSGLTTVGHFQTPPHTSHATSVHSRSFTQSSSLVRRLPSSVEAKPHSQLSQVLHARAASAPNPFAAARHRRPAGSLSRLPPGETRQQARRRGTDFAQATPKRLCSPMTLRPPPHCHIWPPHPQARLPACSRHRPTVDPWNDATMDAAPGSNYGRTGQAGDPSDPPRRKHFPLAEKSSAPR